MLEPHDQQIQVVRQDGLLLHESALRECRREHPTQARVLGLIGDWSPSAWPLLGTESLRTHDVHSVMLFVESRAFAQL
jgi:hypothetical protein